ncbi:MAG: hypothetical protein ABID63_02365 [Pseudomonadota bacterium]
MAVNSNDDVLNVIMKTTRGILASSEAMFGLSPDIALYITDKTGKLQPNPPAQYGQIPMIFYEVSVAETADGSWWIPACSVPDTPSGLNIWGNWEPLKVSEHSTIVTTAMLRPQNALCWVPAMVIEENLTPIIFKGSILGEYPVTKAA